MTPAGGRGFLGGGGRRATLSLFGDHAGTISVDPKKTKASIRKRYSTKHLRK